MMGGQPGVESVGQIVGIELSEQVVEGLVAGRTATEQSSALGQEVQPDTLSLGEELAVSVDRPGG